ncbi:MAG TPA: hypothetical protein VMT64_08145 [Candidatus Binataceae bacterium]|nr:hypothetical protein [Candidatus Binataceae bacterium]
METAREARHNPSMPEEPPFTVRRRELIDKASAVFGADPRILAGWLEGSLADGSADAFSDIDLYLCVADSGWDDLWPHRREFITRIAPILAATEVIGVFGIGCLIEGPVKLDVFFERESTLAAKQRIAVKRLWGPDAIFARMRIGDDLGDAAIARALEYTIPGFMQGATWPVRLLARGQHRTFLYSELFLVENGIVPLMLLERDRRAFHRNMMTRAKLLDAARHAEYARLIDNITRAVSAGDRDAMCIAHLDIHRTLCRLARVAFARYGLTFPTRYEDEMAAFYQREWP